MVEIPFDIIGFDLDGTLLDTSGDLAAAVNHAITAIGRPAYPPDAIRPFVWRRSLDFGAIDAIVDISRRIRDHYAQGQAFGPGYDLKRGRGGIREVEFFAQVHQLIHGGRDPSLRSGNSREALRALLDDQKVQSAVIFCNRKTTVRELNKSLQSHGYKSGEIHGDIDQSSRLAELERFRDGTVNILVASDVAARGLDIKGVSHVFNFDAPWHPDDYVHRIGRTGRAGAKGVAYTFVTNEDAEAIDNIQKLIGTKIDYAPLPGGASEGASSRKDKEDKPAPAKPRREERREEKRGEEKRSEEKRGEEKRSERRRDDRRDRPATKRHNSANEDGPDEGWNGPVPEFLSVGFSN